MCLAVLVLAAFGIRFNVSPSLPVGFYQWHKLTAEEAANLQPSDIVIFCPDEATSRLALERGYLKRGPCPHGSVPMGKPILAVAGEIVEVRPEGVYLNGELIPKSEPREVDSKGREMAIRYGTFEVREGEYFVLATRVAGSLDGRYYGPISAGQIVARAEGL